MFKQKQTKFMLFALSASLLSMGSVYAQLDDPMRPPGYRLFIPGQKKITQAQRFSLSLIQISSTRRSAIVNGRVVEVGSRVNGAKVVGIYPSSVKLKKKGKIFTIKLLSRVVKKTRTR